MEIINKINFKNEKLQNWRKYEECDNVRKGTKNVRNHILRTIPHIFHTLQIWIYFNLIFFSPLQISIILFIHINYT